MPADPSPAGGPGPDGPAPPRLARLLIRRRLPEELAEPLCGDLEEEYRTRILPRRGRLLADLWFWSQALTLRAGPLRRGLRRLRTIRPRSGSRRPGRMRPDPATRIAMILRDLRYALRRLLASPGFTVVAIASLALGIGANTAIFSVVNAVLFRGLPVQEPERVVEVYTSEEDGSPHSTTSYPDYADLRAGTDVFDGVVATRTAIVNLERGGEPAVALGELVSWDYFQTLGVEMELGRAFAPEEGRAPGTHPVTILGHRIWREEFGADPEILGRTVRLSGRPYTVVGVAPEAFTGSLSVLVSSFFVPLQMTNQIMSGSSVDQLERRSSRSLFVKARLRPGVTAEQADQAVAAFSRGLAEAHPETNADRIMSAVPTEDVALHPFVDRALTPVAGLLLGVVGLVLLIACANLASFLLARAEERRREIAVRLALGAGRGALVRQLLVETTLLALLGGVLGLLVAGWTLDLLMSFQPPLPLPVSIDVGLDTTVLAFTAGVSVLAGILFGLVPALQATDPDVAPTLKDEGGGAGRAGGSRLRNGLVVTQVAFSFVLLIGAGLFLRGLQKAQAIDPGFHTGPAALVWPLPELSGYETDQERMGLMRTLERRLLAHPRIERVARADRLPLGAGFQSAEYRLPGVEAVRADGMVDVDNAVVAPGYFETLEVPILRGRAFTEDDAVSGAPVAVVSQAFVERYYPGEDVVGMRLGRGGRGDLRVVGVARDTKVRTLGEDPRPYVYEVSTRDFVVDMQLLVRGRGTGPELLAAAREVLDEVDPDLVLLEAKTMNEHLALMLFPPRMAAMLLGVFGGLALLLSAIGVYGVVSHAVARRTREMGIRISLGASAGDVVRMAVGGGMRLVLAGGALGILAAAGLTWLVSGYLFGISPRDVATFLTIPLVLGLVALAAAWVPARRACRVDPVRALRAE